MSQSLMNQPATLSPIAQTQVVNIFPNGKVDNTAKAGKLVAQWLLDENSKLYCH